MLLFLAQVSNPNDRDKKRFNRFKMKTGKEFKRLEKKGINFDKKQIFRLKSGENFIAIFQFRPI